MKSLIKRLSKVTDSSQYSLLRPDQSSRSRGVITRLASSRKCGRCVPEGHFPVYVGEEMERFVVSAELLNHPIFVKLLNKSAQEYGYEQKGVIRIPCHVFLFERVLDALRCGDEALDLQEILASEDVCCSEGF